jgi:hypothetical protein
MAEDLLAGMTHEEVAKKKYKFTIEIYFYTQPEYIPRDDPHWISVSLINLDDQILNKEGDLTFKAKIVNSEAEGIEESASKPGVMNWRGA